LRDLLTSLCSSMIVFLSEAINIHPDSMVTLCPLRAKNASSEFGKSHSIGVFVRGGCPVPPSPSYHNGGL
jgi:hypothetical protein